MFKHEMMQRTANFGLRVLRLSLTLEKQGSKTGIVLGQQLLRSSTSVGANYRAACHAKSKADFLAKIKICEEEADESEYWLYLLAESGIMQKQQIHDLRVEAHEIASIIAHTAKNMRKQMKNRSDEA